MELSLNPAALLSVMQRNSWAACSSSRFRRRGQIEPVSGGCDLDNSKEAVGQLILLGRLGAVDLELTEHALDAIALLSERPTMFDFPAAV